MTKVKVIVTKEITVEVNDRIFETLRSIHAIGATAMAEQYEDALDTIEVITGKPFLRETAEGYIDEYIIGVYGMDGTTILEA